MIQAVIVVSAIEYLVQLEKQDKAALTEWKHKHQEYSNDEAILVVDQLNKVYLSSLFKLPT